MMKRYALAAIAAGIAVAAGCSKPQDGQETAAAKDPSTDAEKFGYAIGVDLGNSLSPIREQVDIDALVQGLTETMSGKTSRMDEAARNEIKNTVAQNMQAKQLEERGAKADQAKQAGEKFLAENAKKEGVKVTDSGLQYEVITKVEKGASPSAEDRVEVHYRGTLLDGTEFDSSYSRGKTAEFGVNRVIAGWTEGLQLMKVGEKFKFYIPAELAYGERGAGARIGPNETLTFEVELIKVEPAEKK